MGLQASTYSRRHRAAVLGLAWVCIVAVVLVVGLVVSGPLTGSVGSAENSLARWLAAHRTPDLNAVAETVALLGDTRTVMVVAPVLTVGVWVWRRQTAVSLFVPAVVVGEVACYLLTTNVVDRPRPPVRYLDRGLDPNHSFPSGHVAATVALWGSVAVLLWCVAEVRRRWVVTLFALPPLAVALARLYQGVHHVSDVLASVVFTSVWLALTAAVLVRPPPLDRGASAT